ncbi:MAG: transposase [Gammaproteobacteria bacterium]|nr:transposase [Gammaproteobacteria bacterium]MBT4145503.1 transposase [Gammaproteobacteria bacterium]MBT5223547.1 transposase [Gammaproteobacteria bacterium]MBT5825770.1 transposase [Gammaproteobacteria bacterium]MBT6419148.1 transposase [Gammaproteobacteria bacterium]
MTKYLCGLEHKINRKRVQRLMKTLGLVDIAPGPIRYGVLILPIFGCREVLFI